METKATFRGQPVYEFNETIKEVTPNDFGYDVKTVSSKCFAIHPIDTKVEPKVGDEITLYTIQYSRIIGMALNGQLLYFYADDEVLR